MTIKEYQSKCFREYKTDIGYPNNYTYLTGSPINALVPIETAERKVMIIGAYPSAKFYTVNGIADTPMADINCPFSDETYFDGSRIRSVLSGSELNNEILKKIGVSRNECWITNLVKVFLFKPGHITRYLKLQKEGFCENRSDFDKYAIKSLPWLEIEINICDPKVIILLGVEVTKTFFQVSAAKAMEMLSGEVFCKKIGGIDRSFICLPHPGILMKQMERNLWPEKFRNEISVKAKNEIAKLLN
jgi:uracil-DNA glycosylase family 4